MPKLSEFLKLHMACFNLVLLILILPAFSVAGPTIKSSDLVVIARNTDLDDQFALVALADIPGSSVIFLTDEGWDDSDFTFDGSEDVFKWTVHADGISAGTIIRLTNESTTTLEIEDSGHGTVESVNGSSDMNLSAGDQLFIYQTANDAFNGTIQRKNGEGVTEAGMIYAFNGDNSSPNTNGWLDAGNSHTSAASQLPDNMTPLSTSDGSGNASIADANGMLTQAALKDSSADEYDNYKYDGPTTAAEKNDWLIRIHTVANWLASDSDSLSLNTGALASDLTIALPNTSPTISMDNTLLSYTENNSAIKIDAAATANDADGDSDWDGGTLVVQVTANGEASDQLTMPDNVVGNINTSGTNLLDNVTVIGTLSASEGTVTGGTALTITFDSDATNSLVQQTVRAVHYESTSEDPGTSNRTVTFTLTDKNSASANDTRTLLVSKADNDAPTMVTNNGLTLNEGATAAIPLDSLEATDIDYNDANINYVLTDGPDNGQLENTDNEGVSISSFIQQYLTDGKIQYVHDGGNSISDSFTFKVADSKPNELTGQTFSINVTPVDDDTPTISTNNGLNLNEGATAAIPIDSLEANDSDTDNSTLTFTVTSHPSNGQLENLDNLGVSISSYTQQDLTDGKIQYVHGDGNNTSDSFTFKVADGVPNELTGQTFSITITPVDDDTPTISTNNGLNLTEGATAAIPLDSLQANDEDTDNSTLRFTVTSSPSHGQLENTDNPGVSISSFIQQSLTDGKIQYVHDGTNTTSDSFTFKVADGVPNEFTGLTFSINVISVDDANIWMGVESTDWHTAANWSEAETPNSSLDVDIPAAVNQPSISINSAECKKLIIQDGATLTIGENGALTVNDTYTKKGSGGISASGGGYAIIKGDIYKDGDKRLEVDSAEGIKISSGLTLP